MKKLLDLLKKLAQDKWYGELTIKFKNGKVAFWTESKTVVPEDIGG